MKSLSNKELLDAKNDVIFLINDAKTTNEKLRHIELKSEINKEIIKRFSKFSSKAN